MKNLLVLLLSSILLITISCQKQEMEVSEVETQELEIPEVKYKRITYEIPSEVLGGEKGVRPSCSCYLNVKANRDNTGLGQNADWRVMARIKGPQDLFYQTYALFGGTQAGAYQYESSADFPNNDSRESIPFNAPSYADAKLIFDIPYTLVYPDFIDTHLIASITCSKQRVNQGPLIAGERHAFIPSNSGLWEIEGRIDNCSANTGSSGGSGM